MAISVAAPTAAPRERVLYSRLLWAAPLTVLVAVVLNYAIKLIVQALDPSLNRMGQLGPPLISLTIQGAVGAVIVFALLGLLVRRPLTWYRWISLAVLVLSLLPDIALGFGGQTAMLGMRAMGPFLQVEIPGLAGPPRGGPPPGGPGGGGPPGGAPGGGPPSGFVMPAMSAEQVAILILLHVAAAAVCIWLLPRLAGRVEPSSPPPSV